MRVEKNNWYLDEHGFDSAHYLFHELYHCRVPYIQSMSLDEISYFGMPTVGDSTIDMQMANDDLDVYYCIVKICIMMESGAAVSLVKPSDSKQIYERVERHLHDWKHYISRGSFNRTAPIDDLLRLDKFANQIYEHAKWHFDNEFMNLHVTTKVSKARLNMMSLVQGIEAGAFERKPAQQSEMVEDAGRQFPRRQSMAGDFAPLRTVESLNSLNRQREMLESAQKAREEMLPAARAPGVGPQSAAAFARLLFNDDNNPEGGS